MKKELSELFRDKSTFRILLISALIFPVLSIGLNYLSKDSETHINICLENDNSPAYSAFADFLADNEKFDIVAVESDIPNELLKNGDIDIIVSISEDTVNFEYNSFSYNSLSLAAKLGEEFEKYCNDTLYRNYDGIFTLNLIDENGNTADTTGSVTKIVVPVMFILLIFQGTSSFSNDMFAGEKERKTMEMLLLSGIKRKYIYYGKCMTLAVISSINLILGFVSCILSFGNSDFELMRFMPADGGAILNIIFIILIIIILAAISVCLSSAVSMAAGSMKNAQILNEIVLAVPVAMAFLLLFGIIKSNIILSFIPVLNLIYSFCCLVSGNTDVVSILISFLVSGIFTAAAVKFSIRYINSEKIIM